MGRFSLLFSVFLSLSLQALGEEKERLIPAQNTDIPCLTHPSVEWSFASKHTVLSSRPYKQYQFLQTHHIDWSTPLKNVYIAFKLHYGGTSGGAQEGKVLLGNTELGLRFGWESRSGFSSGLSLMGVFPTGRFERQDQTHLRLSSIAPMHQVSFVPNGLGIRPALELQFSSYPFLFQSRYGFDLMMNARETEWTRSSVTLLVYGAYAMTEHTSFSLEASEAYIVGGSDSIHDTRRMQINLTPALSLSYKHAQLSGGFFWIYQPLYSETETAYGFQLGMKFSY